MDSSITHNPNQCAFDFEALNLQPVEDLVLRVVPLYPPNHKQCNACFEVKPITAFGRNREYHDQKQKICKKCIKNSKYKKAIAEPGQTKECNTCHKAKPITDFSSDGGSRSRFGVRGTCKDCNAIYRKEYMQTHPHKYDPNRKKTDPKKARIHLLRKKYDLTADQYDEMLVIQNGVCALCDRPERVRDGLTGKIKNLCVDHSHSTGRVRALLCQDCNLVLGKIEDNPLILDRAADYLEKHK